MAYNEVTGRDGYLIAQALHVAIRHLEALPEIERPTSNIEDMRAILLTNFGGFVQLFVMEDDAKSALAELPPDASNEERKARLQDVMEQWNEANTGKRRPELGH
jgi:hypothetical protein